MSGSLASRASAGCGPRVPYVGLLHVGAQVVADGKVHEVVHAREVCAEGAFAGARGSCERVSRETGH